jgi:hypothetical protein
MSPHLCKENNNGDGVVIEEEFMWAIDNENIPHKNQSNEIEKMDESELFSLPMCPVCLAYQ